MATIENKKLGALLKQLTKTEFEQIEAWIEMEKAADKRHDRKNQAIDLLKILKEPAAWTLSNQELWPQLFPGEPFKNSQFSKLLSYLADVIEMFLANEILKSNNVKRQQLVLDELEKRKAWQSIEKVANEMESKNFKKIALNADRFHQQYEKEVQLNRSFIQRKSLIPKEVIRRRDAAFDKWLLYSAMEKICSDLNHQILHPANPAQKIALQEEIIELVRSSYLDDPVLKAFYLAYSLLMDPTQSIDLLLEHVINIHKQISTGLARHFRTIMLNVTGQKRAFMQKQEIIRLYLHVYDTFAKKMTFSQQISPQELKNMLHLSMMSAVYASHREDREKAFAKFESYLAEAKKMKQAAWREVIDFGLGYRHFFSLHFALEAYLQATPSEQHKYKNQMEVAEKKAREIFSEIKPQRRKIELHIRLLKYQLSFDRFRLYGELVQDDFEAFNRFLRRHKKELSSKDADDFQERFKHTKVLIEEKADKLGELYGQIEKDEIRWDEWWLRLRLKWMKQEGIW